MVELTPEERTAENFNEIVFEFNGQSEMYRPSSKSLTECAREQFRIDRSFDLDLGLMSLRHLNKIKKVAEETKFEKNDDSTPSSCSSLTFSMTDAIEPGSILVCHPASCLSPTYLEQIGDSSH